VERVINSRVIRAIFSSCALFILCLAVLPMRASYAQNEGQEAAQRLQQGKSGKNKFRSTDQSPSQVSSMSSAKQNMEQLFEKILISGRGDDKADDWYEPHLRDMWWDPTNRQMEAVDVRGQTAPYDYMLEYCRNPYNVPIQAACPEKNWMGFETCLWHGEPGSAHRPMEACYTKNTLKYKQLTQDSNFKVCCVRDGEATMTSEEIVSKHPDGDGWAGLFEYYYPTSALGWENERGNSMIVDDQKIKECKQEAGKILNGTKGTVGAEWVAGAIQRNLKAAGGDSGGENSSNLNSEVQSVIGEVQPQDKDLSFTDSLQGEGLTLRVNLAAMDPEYRKKVAQRFCMRPEQLDKLMVPGQDKLQQGGGLSLSSLDDIPVWANYCPQGVELMTDPKKSNELINVDNTPTKLNLGTQAWEKDPLYCQRMNLINPSMNLSGIGDVIRKSQGAGGTEASVGYSCLTSKGGNLNGGMAPVTLYRHAAVERRTAIADHAVGFLIAGALAPGMISGKQSYYKRFEPQRYSMQVPYQYQTFIGRPFKGGRTNELGDSCPSVNATIPPYTSKSDRLYISNKTHEPFTQKKIDESNTIDKYVHEWADQQPDKIAKKGLDDKANNYAAAFRIFATCPAGYTRWRPPNDEHNMYLVQNLNQFCREENFGGPE